jgi:hypothetical protein
MKANTNKPLFSLSVIASALLFATSAQANVSDGISQAVKDSKVGVNLRYRYENVDEDNANKNADASTLRSRITVNTGKFNNFSATIEVDDVSTIGADDYNSTTNGNGQYSVVADPTGTEVNQASITYQQGMAKFTLGRQRVVLDDQRFVGGVAWRQNEQTYDGYRLVLTPNDNFKIDASYIHNVNRIFGEDSPNSDLDGDVILINANYQINKAHKLVGFYYGMEFDNNAAFSNDTYGFTYNGKLAISDKNKIALKAGFASQSDAGDNPTDYDADYLTAEAMFITPAFGLGAGYELLGSDDSIKAFQTPLATLHKFNGFADKFLGTPADGLEDVYVKATTKINGVKLAAIYHDYTVMMRMSIQLILISSG